MLNSSHELERQGSVTIKTYEKKVISLKENMGQRKSWRREREGCEWYKQGTHV